MWSGALAFLKKAWPYLLAAGAGAIIAWQIQGIRIGSMQNDIAKLTDQVKVCQNANATSEATIKSLRTEIKNASDVCSKRINAKNKILQDIQAIDSIKVPNEDKEKPPDDGAADPLLAALNGMYPSKSDRKD